MEPAMNTRKQLPRTFLPLLALIFSISLAAAEEGVKPSGRTVVAEVVAFDQCFYAQSARRGSEYPKDLRPAEGCGDG